MRIRVKEGEKMRRFSWSKWLTACFLAGGVAVGLVYAQPPSPHLPVGSATRVLGSPVRIAAMDNGPLLVTDYTARSVCMVNRTKLDVLRCFPIEGNPLAVAWVDGRVYVGNETTGAVEVYNPEGEWQFDLGSGKGTIKKPTDMAVDENSRKIFVTDGNEKNIKVFSFNGVWLYTITGTLWGAERLVNPTGIALDAVQGEVFVSDYGDPAQRFPARILVFDLDGNYLRSIPGRAGGFSRPQGLAVEGDRLFVADSMLGAILVFDRATGTKVKTLGSFGSGPGQLMLPLDVLALAATGDVFVTNNRNSRVERFAEGGIVP